LNDGIKKVIGVVSNFYVSGRNTSPLIGDFDLSCKIVAIDPFRLKITQKIMDKSLLLLNP